MVSILDPLTAPYIGTVFNLIGIVNFNHQSVDTAVTTSRIWSGSNGLPQTTSQNNDSLIFQPITTNTSGVYTLTVTVRPSDDSGFIVGSSGSASYNLVVNCKLVMQLFIMVMEYLSALHLYSSSLPTSCYRCCISTWLR